jgi:uncharacterized protein (TIGR03067 family)
MIEGTWIPISAELSGRPFPQQVLQTMRLVLTENSYVARVGDVNDTGIVTLHSETHPSSMEILGTEGPNKGKTLLAIYEQTEDTLRVCYDLEGKNRPQEFKTQPNTQLFLVEYRRAQQ